MNLFFTIDKNKDSNLSALLVIQIGIVVSNPVSSISSSFKRALSYCLVLMILPTF